MAVELKINLIADTQADALYAVEKAIRKMNEGHDKGSLMSNSVFIGQFQIQEVCSTCLGVGTIPTDESDGDGNIEKGVGERKCPDCKR